MLCNLLNKNVLGRLMVLKYVGGWGEGPASQTGQVAGAASESPSRTSSKPVPLNGVRGNGPE